MNGSFVLAVLLMVRYVVVYRDCVLYPGLLVRLYPMREAIFTINWNVVVPEWAVFSSCCWMNRWSLARDGNGSPAVETAAWGGDWSGVG